MAIYILGNCRIDMGTCYSFSYKQNIIITLKKGKYRSRSIQRIKLIKELTGYWHAVNRLQGI